MTTYVHPLDGPHSIADWFAGSTLQPFLERLGDDERCEFLARYRAGLKDAYPVQPDGRTLFAYPAAFHRRGQGGGVRRANERKTRMRSHILRVMIPIASARAVRAGPWPRWMICC